MKKIAIYILLFSLVNCTSEINLEVDYQSDRYGYCNTVISTCNGGDGDYCLFGFKWGAGNGFEAGFEESGPQIPGGTISFSFQEENGTVNTHSEINVPSLSFDLLMDCARDEIRNATMAWSSVADIQFVELPVNSEADMQIFVANIRQGGVGYPNYLDSPCDALRGDVIINPSLSTFSCHDFFIFSLHEIGHVLGLGHVRTPNIMNQNIRQLNLNGLQNGDIKGVQEIYGAPE